MCPSWYKISAKMKAEIEKGRTQTPEVSHYREKFTPRKARAQIPESSLKDAPTFNAAINENDDEDLMKPMIK